MAAKKLYRLIFFLLAISNMALCQQPKLVLPIGHVSGITEACFSPNGKYVLTTSYDGTAKLWSAQTGMLLKNYDPRIGPLIYGAFNKDGSRFITMSDDSISKIFSVKNSSLLPAAAWSPDSAWKQQGLTDDGIKKIDSSGEVEMVSISEIKTGKILQRFGIPGTVVQKAIFSPDHNKILTVSPYPACYLWDVTTGELLCSMIGYTPFLRLNPAFSQDGKKIITVAQDSVIKCWTDEEAVLLPAIHGKTAMDLPNQIRFWHEGKEILVIDSSSQYVKMLGWENGNIGKRIKITATDAELLEEYLGRPVEKADTVNKDWREDLYEFQVGSWDVVLAFMLNPDESRLLTLINKANTRGIVMKLWDNKKNVALMNEWYGYIPWVDFSVDGKYFFMLDEDHSLLMFDSKSGKQMAVLERKLKGGIINDDRSTIVTMPGNGRINTRSGKDGKLLRSFIVPAVKKYTAESLPDVVPLIAISKDGKKIAVAYTEGNLLFIDGITGKLISDNKVYHVSKTDPNAFFDIGFSPDGKEMFSADPNGNSSFWSADDGKFIASLKGEFGAYTKPVYSPDGNKILTTSADNSINIWDAKTHSLQYSFFQVDSMDYMYVLPSGYYKTTGSATHRLHYVTKDFDVMTFEQLDVKYNRPDKILEATGCKNKALIESYRNAYYKRLQKLGIDSSSFSETYSMPVTNIMNAAVIPSEQKNEKLSIHIKATDSIFKLDRLNVWINEVPLFGIKGFNIRKEETNSLDTNITINLSNGENKIEASVTNVNGIESYRKPLLVKYIPVEKKTGKVYFIGVGINHFADSTHDLKWCVQDIRDLTTTMKAKYGDRLVIVDTLYNEKATRTNIRALKKKLLNTTVNDKVIFSYSGHGMLSKDYDYYISSYTINFSNPEEGGIPYDEIENMLDSIPARKKILLLDACHSGEVDKEEMKKIQNASSGLSQNHTTINTSSRGVIVTSTDSVARVGLQNSFDLMQSLFVNVGKGTGAIIISASGGVQFAQERSELGHGVFTYSVIEAMKKYPSIKISELRKYIYDRVLHLTNGLQKPTTRSEPIAVDWEL